VGGPLDGLVELAPGQSPVTVDQRETLPLTSRCVTKNIREVEVHSASLSCSG
jgi:hypothetical protein